MVASSLEAMALGALQGVTEFLPVSSDGHLALATLLFDIEDGGLAFNTMLHLGTLLATVIVFSGPVRELGLAGLRGIGAPSRLRQTPAGRDLLQILVISIPTAAIGLLLEPWVDGWTREPLVIGLGFLLTAVALMATGWAKERDRSELSWPLSLLVGAIQGVAVLPGVSRSGLTIATLLLLGMRGSRAFQLSMLMSLPVVAGAVMLELPKARQASTVIMPSVLGTVTASLVGLLALLLLGRVVARRRFGWFALWVAPLALATLAFAKAWPGR